MNAIAYLASHLWWIWPALVAVGALGAGIGRLLTRDTGTHRRRT